MTPNGYGPGVKRNVRLMAKLTGHLMAKLTGHLQKEDLKEYNVQSATRARAARPARGPGQPVTELSAITAPTSHSRPSGNPQHLDRTGTPTATEEHGFGTARSATRSNAGSRIGVSPATGRGQRGKREQREDKPNERETSNRR